MAKIFKSVVNHRGIMKKANKHTDLSRVKCKVKGCTKYLKQRIVDNKPTARVCYQHHVLQQASRNHIMSDLQRYKVQ